VRARLALPGSFDAPEVLLPYHLEL